MMLCEMVLQAPVLDGFDRGVLIEFFSAAAMKFALAEETHRWGGRYRERLTEAEWRETMREHIERDDLIDVALLAMIGRHRGWGAK